MSSGVILNADEIAALIADAIQDGINTGAASILHDAVEHQESTTVTCTGSSQEIFAANANRRAIIFQNRDGLSDMRIKFGGSVSATDSMVIGPKETYKMDMNERDVRSFNVLGPSGTKFVAIQVVIQS